MRDTPLETRILGLGSPHGDDRVGWLVVDRLAEINGLNAQPVALRRPADLLDHLDGCCRLIVIDACHGGARAGTLLRFDWPDSRLQAYSGQSTHGLSVVETLRLASTLKKCPREVVLFAVEITRSGPSDAPCSAVLDAVERLVGRIVGEVGRAV